MRHNFDTKIAPYMAEMSAYTCNTLHYYIATPGGQAPLCKYWRGHWPLRPPFPTPLIDLYY